MNKDPKTNPQDLCSLLSQRAYQLASSIDNAHASLLLGTRPDLNKLYTLKYRTEELAKLIGKWWAHEDDMEHGNSIWRSSKTPYVEPDIPVIIAPSEIKSFIEDLKIVANLLENALKVTTHLHDPLTTANNKVTQLLEQWTKQYAHIQKLEDETWNR